MAPIVTIYSIGVLTALSFINFIIILKGIKDEKYIWFNVGVGALMIGYIAISCILAIDAIVMKQ